MEKWKIAVIAALLVALVGFGIMQNSSDNKPVGPLPTQGSPAKIKPSRYLGKTLPTWNFKIWNGKPVSQQSLLGKPALVEIFRIECPHCQEAAPFMEGLMKRYGPKGLKIVGIQSPQLDNPQENNWTDVQAWLKQHGTPYPVAFDEKSAYFLGTIKKEIFKGHDEEMAWPTMLILNKQGKVTFAHTGFDTGNANNVGAIIDFAVAMEKTFPSGKSVKQNALSLVEWLQTYIPDLGAGDEAKKELVDDVAKRLKK